jgi:hypothetical protein
MSRAERDLALEAYDYGGEDEPGVAALDSTDDDEFDERDAVTEADADALLADTLGRLAPEAGGTAEPPLRLDDAERDDMRRRRELSQQRSALRSRGGRLAPVDERGVRDATTAPLLAPDDLRALRRDEQQDVLRPYRREGGFDARARLMTTSWVRNVRFDATLRSDTAPIELRGVRARRYVAPANPPIGVALGVGGVAQQLSVGALRAGEEYAVFAYALRDDRDARIYSSPTLALDIDLVARYDGVARDTNALRSAPFRLAFGPQVHAVLEENGTAGSVVRLDEPRPLEIFKQAAPLSAAPVATVTGGNFRYTLRYDPAPAVRRWRLTFAEWWIKRSQLQEVADADAQTYYRAEISVNGQLIDPSRVTVLASEDGESNPLAPAVQLEIFPGEDARTGRPLPLRRDQSIEVRVYASTRIAVPPRSDVLRDASRTDARTKWALLPGASFQQFADAPLLSFFENSSNELLREAVPARSGDVRRVFRRARQPLADFEATAERDGGGARGVAAAEVEWRLVDDYDEFRAEGDFLAIESLRVGPLSLAGIRQAAAARTI